MSANGDTSPPTTTPSHLLPLHQPAPQRPTMPLQFATRLNNVETSAIRELFKLLGKPGIISFAGGFPDAAMFDVGGIKDAVNKALLQEAGGALQYGATEGYEPLREQLSLFMAGKGVAVGSDGLIVTTG